MMNTKIKAYRGIAIVLSLFGVAAILFSMFSDHNEHNYALLMGLGSINIANILHCFAYRMKK
jgi:inner membrane protein involved in colicin E2 resistance